MGAAAAAAVTPFGARRVGCNVHDAGMKGTIAIR